MGFLEEYDDAQGEDFRKRVQIALQKTASAILGEAQGAMGAVKWDKRHNFAYTAISNPGSVLAAYATAVVADGTTTSASTDTVIENRVISLFDDFAGVKNGD
jgi:hypothetical protein